MTTLKLLSRGKGKENSLPESTAITKTANLHLLHCTHFLCFSMDKKLSDTYFGVLENWQILQTYSVYIRNNSLTLASIVSIARVKTCAWWTVGKGSMHFVCLKGSMEGLIISENGQIQPIPIQDKALDTGDGWFWVLYNVGHLDFSSGPSSTYSFLSPVEKRRYVSSRSIVSL